MEARGSFARRFTLCAVLVLTTAHAYAQRPLPVHKASVADRTNDVLYERNRSLMHPGDPLLLVGREQGDNDMRARTPALAQGDRTIAQVDATENYNRTIALYEDRATFRRPLAAVAVTPDGQRAPTTAPNPKTKPSVNTPQQTGSDWPWLLALGLPMGFIAWFFTRAKTAEKVPRRKPVPTL